MWDQEWLLSWVLQNLHPATTNDIQTRGSPGQSACLSSCVFRESREAPSVRRVPPHAERPVENAATPSVPPLRRPVLHFEKERSFMNCASNTSAPEGEKQTSKEREAIPDKV